MAMGGQRGAHGADIAREREKGFAEINLWSRKCPNYSRNEPGPWERIRSRFSRARRDVGTVGSALPSHGHGTARPARFRASIAPLRRF